MLKRLFFKLFNYSNPSGYEQQYDSLQCRRENDEIRKILKTYVDPKLPITDIGCGTGLGSQLIQNHDYVGVDHSEAAIAYCMDHYSNIYCCTDAETYIRGMQKINPIFLFSIDYLDVSVVRQYLDKTDRIFIAIRYNAPYLSQTSVYQKKKWIYSLLHPEAKRQKLNRLFKDYHAEEWNLLGEPYYTVTIVRKKP